jgi:hypothetical protein
VPGIDQLFEIIGSHSVDALVAQIHRNEHGIPENPTISMVEGHWTEDAQSLRPIDTAKSISRKRTRR